MRFEYSQRNWRIRRLTTIEGRLAHVTSPLPPLLYVCPAGSRFHRFCPASCVLVYGFLPFHHRPHISYDKNLKVFVLMSRSFSR